MEGDSLVTPGVALVAPSGYERAADRIERAVTYFETRGYAVTLAPHPSRREERFAASDDERLLALHEAARRPDVELVVALRGGYGLARLLGRIDYPLLAASIQERGALWVGHSDFTALGLALWARAGAVSYSGPMAAADFGAAPVEPFTEAAFWAVAAGGPQQVQWASAGHDLEAEGTLWGGNLAIVASLLGTPYMPSVEGGLLYLEDVNEPAYRLERLFLQLYHAGILARQRAVLLGDFSGGRPAEPDPYDPNYNVARVVQYLERLSAVPVLSGVPIGHIPRKCTLPVGRTGRLVRERGTARLVWDEPARARPRGD